MRKNAVFTSAGNRTVISSWLPQDGRRSWDLLVAYYGESDEVFASLSQAADLCVRCKGSKFQNLKKLVAERPGLLDRYDAVWVVDDDIVVTPPQIEALFSVQAKYGLWVLQPSCSPKGRIDIPITAHQAGQHLFRYVNFVEVMAPLFDRVRLTAFLEVYDGSLVGWGIDWWYGNFFEADRFARMAIVDAVVVVNPHAHEKPGSGEREIDLLQPAVERAQAWRAKAATLGLREYTQRTIGLVIDMDLLRARKMAESSQ